MDRMISNYNILCEAVSAVSLDRHQRCDIDSLAQDFVQCLCPPPFRQVARVHNLELIQLPTVLWNYLTWNIETAALCSRCFLVLDSVP